MSQSSSTSSIGDQNIAGAKDYTAAIIAGLIVLGLVVLTVVLKKKKP